MSQPEKNDPLLLGVILKSKAESFLVDLANFNPQGLSDRSVERFFRRWGELFSSYELDTDAGRADLYNFLKLQLGERLRTAWNAPTLRERGWYAPQIRQIHNANSVDRSEDGKRLLPLAMQREFHGGGATIVEDLKKLTEHDAAAIELRRLRIALPPIEACDVALEHFERILDRVSHCQNPTCHTPYFLAAKFGQKYCSGPCARPAQAAAKRKWWSESGSQWRREKNKRKKGGK
jgi:hypothetical protein